jgi:hypothetical protein
MRHRRAQVKEDHEDDEDYNRNNACFWAPSEPPADLSNAEKQRLRRPVGTPEARQIDAELRREEPRARKQDTIDTLARQFSQLKVNDPQFSQVYIQLLTEAPEMVKVWESMAKTLQASWQPMNTSSPARPPSSNQNRPYSGSGSNSIPLGGARQNMECFGCGKIGHMSRNCPEMRELQNAREVIQDDNFRWMLSSGQSIPRKRDDNTPLAQIVKQMIRARPVNAVGIVMYEEGRTSRIEEVEEDEDLLPNPSFLNDGQYRTTGAD